MRARSSLPVLALAFVLAAPLACGAPPPSSRAAVEGSQRTAEGLAHHRGTRPPVDGDAPPGASPTIVHRATFSTLYAVSDVHGDYDRLVTLLRAAGLLAAIPPSPDEPTWSGGDATFVVAGDLFDKGPRGLDVVRVVRALQASAARSGGEVVVLLGNHEAEFFADDRNKKATKADGISAELSGLGLDPDDFVSGADPRGAWLAALPFAAVVGDVFLAHAGDADGLTEAALASRLDAARLEGWSADAIVGPSSILESRDWWRSPAAVREDLAALGVAHIVFGHDPSAVGPKGAIAALAGGTVTRIDCGMSSGVDYGRGEILVVRHGVDGAADDVASAVDASGSTRPLWRAARTR